MPRSVTLALTMLILLTAGLAAQEHPSLSARLGRETEALLRPVLDSAAHDGLPVGALESKALEGVAKGRPPDEIRTVVRRLADRLRQARAILTDAEPDTPVAPREIVTASEALESGVSPGDIARLRRNAPAKTSLEIPFAVLGELVRRGVPGSQARDVVAGLVQSKVPEERIVGIPARMDVGIRGGAPPVQALGRALQGMGLPVPPSFPHPGNPGKGNGRGRGRGGGGR